MISISPGSLNITQNIAAHDVSTLTPSGAGCLVAPRVGPATSDALVDRDRGSFVAIGL
jgi:hypothetical protein